MKVFSRRLRITLLVLVIAYAFCLELCARESAALVMLAGTLARGTAVIAMMLLLLLRLVLFVFMPAYLSARVALYALAPPHAGTKPATDTPEN